MIIACPDLTPTREAVAVLNDNSFHLVVNVRLQLGVE